VVTPSLFYLRLQVKSVAGNKPRFDHCMEAIPICPGVTEVMLFGGCPQWPKNFRSYDDFPHMAQTALARFGKLYVKTCVCLCACMRVCVCVCGLLSREEKSSYDSKLGPYR